MSHVATHWALTQRGLKPATKIVLFYLSDRHNPDYGCFPSQSTLADDCEMSKRSVQNHIKELEERGLICKEHRIRNGAFTSDRYFLAFEDGFKPAPCAKSATGKPAQEPVAKSATGRAQTLPPNLVSLNPVIEPVIKQTKENHDLEFEDWWTHYPKKVEKAPAKAEFIKARKKASYEILCKSLIGYIEATKTTEKRYIISAGRWLKRERWLDDQSHANNGHVTAEADLAALGATRAEDDMASLFSASMQLPAPEKY